jgi:ATP-binding cassette subfamily F protein uup
MQRLERQIDRLSSREKELTEDLAAHASDYARLVELGGQLREVQAEKARLEEDWLTAAEDAG